MTRKGNDGQVGNSSTHATGYTLYLRWENWVIPRASKKWQINRQIACMTPVSMSSPNRCQSIYNFCVVIDWSSLTNTNRYQLTNVIDWYRLIDWFSDHLFPSIGYSGMYTRVIYNSLLTCLDLSWKPPGIHHTHGLLFEVWSPQKCLPVLPLNPWCLSNFSFISGKKNVNTKTSKQRKTNLK